MKASDVVNRALRIVGVIASGEEAGASDSADALQAMNDLFSEWRGSGIKIEDASAASLTSDLTIDAADKEAVAYQVALRIGPDYGWEPSALTMKNAMESFNRMQLRYFAIEPADYSHMPGARAYFDINHG